jgi:curved DNA-binding protein CbpA
VGAKNFYQILEIAADAPAEEIKRSFRAQIARYHPDKVQHLGTEFQSMAAERAAELTEAYRILSHPERRAEYDRALAGGGGPMPPVTAQPAAVPHQSVAATPQETPSPSVPPRSSQFKEERATRDDFVRKATLARLRQALQAVAGGYDESQVRGFDIALVPKKPLFGRSKHPRLLGRFVSELDREAVADAWLQAVKWGDTKTDEVCVLLMGNALASAGELAGEIADQRRKSRAAKVTVIPVDARVWEAHMPLDAPVIAKALVSRLKSGS